MNIYFYLIKRSKSECWACFCKIQREIQFKAETTRKKFLWDVGKKLAQNLYNAQFSALCIVSSKSNPWINSYIRYNFRACSWYTSTFKKSTKIWERHRKYYTKIVKIPSGSWNQCCIRMNTKIDVYFLYTSSLQSGSTR